MAAPESTLPRSIEAPVGAAPRGPALFQVLCATELSRSGRRHRLAGLAGVSIGRSDGPKHARVVKDGGTWLELGFADGRVSGTHGRIVPALHRFAIEDLGSKNGTFVNGEPVRRAVLVDGDVIEIGNTFLIFHESVPDDGAGDAEPSRLGDLVTLWPELGTQLGRLARVATIDESVLIQGESGTGKELVARAAHEASGRSGAFVAVNCGALPETMVEAELFGHKRGAFSGAAADRPGLVRSAAGGTLFLDEIGDLRLTSQAALLRMLQERQVTPLGSDSPVSVDVRVVCATHRPLETLARSGDFRADLLARLRGFTVTLPPLRARRVDLGLIVRSLLGRLCEGRPLPTLSTAAVRALFTYPWPHNVRELEKALATALALAEAGPIRAEHLPERVQKATQGAAAVAVAPPAPSAADGVMPRAAGAELATGSDVPGASVASGAGGGSGASESQGLPRRERLVALMREYQGNVAAVARVLGKARTQIHRWLDRYGIDPDEYRS